MTYLILKDVEKVTGQVSGMAVLLTDPGPRMAAWAKNFFSELSHRQRNL